MGRYLNYLELDGDCYFSTKIVPNSDTEINLDVMFTAEGYDNRDAVFVGCTTPNEQDTACYIANYDSDNRITAKYGDGDILDETRYFTDYGIDNRWTLVLTPGVYKQIYDEFTSDVVQFTFSNFGNANADITIGGLNGDNGLERGAICRIYGVQIYQDGNLVGDFKPYEDDFDGLGFLNDVSGTFTPNLGQGTPVGPQPFGIVPSAITVNSGATAITANVTGVDSFHLGLGTYSGGISVYDDQMASEINVTISDNFDPYDKSYYVEVLNFDTSETARLDITQLAGAPPALSVTPSEINIAASGGVITAYVQNSNSWTYTDVHSSTASIIADGINNTLVITIGENFDTGNTIEHVVEVRDQVSGDYAEITITQSAAHTPTYDELLYIENGVSGSSSTDFLIDTHYIPTTATSVEIGLSVSNSDGTSIFSTDSHGSIPYSDYNGWWRFFTYQSYNMVFDCPSDSDARVKISCDARAYNEFKMWWSGGTAYMQIGSGNTYNQSTSRTPNFTTSLKLWGTNSSLYTGTKIYFIRIYEAGNLAMELVPAKIGNNVGLYETITDTLFTNDRQGVFTYEYPTPPTPPTPTSGNTFYLGDVAVSKVYLGDEEISKIYLGEELVFEAGGTPSYDTEPLTFNILSSGDINWTDPMDNHHIEYSTDNGTTWAWVTAGTPISVSQGDVVSFRGDNSNYYTSNRDKGLFSGTTADFTIEGNILSMIDSTNYATSGYVQLSSYALDGLFQGCDTLLSAEHLVLPSTTLANYCYAYMFAKCASLTTAPVLPADTLADRCYQFMFSGCTSLTTAPELQTTNLAQYCYANMFQGCTSLTTAPELPATSLQKNCYQCMFYGCTSLTTAPALPAENLQLQCYYSMFTNCSLLDRIVCLAKTNINSNNLMGWTRGVSAIGTFVKNSQTSQSTFPSGQDGIPSGWQVEDYA